jgi:hypothetical protein
MCVRATTTPLPRGVGLWVEGVEGTRGGSYVSSKTYSPSNSPPFTNPALSVPAPAPSTSTSTLVTVTDDGGDAEPVAGVEVEVDLVRDDRGERNAFGPFRLVCVCTLLLLDGDTGTEDSTRNRFGCLSSPFDRGLPPPLTSSSSEDRLR